MGSQTHFKIRKRKVVSISRDKSSRFNNTEIIKESEDEIKENEQVKEKTTQDISSNSQ